MSLVERLYEAITGADAQRAVGPLNTVGMTRAVVAKHGSNVRAAAALGVSESSVRRWLAGSKPRAHGALVEQYRHTLVTSARESQLRAGDITLRFHQEDRRYPTEGRSRLVDQRGLQLQGGTMDEVMDKWLAGDDRGAARALHGGIGDRHYRDAIPIEDDDDTPDAEMYALT